MHSVGYAHTSEDCRTTLGALEPGSLYRYVDDDDGLYEVLWKASTGAVWVRCVDDNYGREQHNPDLEVYPTTK